MLILFRTAKERTRTGRRSEQQPQLNGTENFKQSTKRQLNALPRKHTQNLKSPVRKQDDTAESDLNKMG
jgi:hypothetical protein